MTVEEQKIEQCAHELVEDIGLRRNVGAYELDGGLVLHLIEEHVGGDVVDRAGTKRTYRKIYEIRYNAKNRAICVPLDWRPS